MVRVPREWLKRWSVAADNIDWQGVSREAYGNLRMVALKTSGIWAAIGSTALLMTRWMWIIRRLRSTA